MPVTIVAGAQWGDEGKGRIVDLLAQEADIVVRCQGGPNAGHTVINDKGRFVLHGIPSGIFSERAFSIIGAGTVINPVSLAEEIKALRQAGIDTGRLLISERAHLIMPYHMLLERIYEEERPDAERVAPTGQGVGPAYADKAARVGFRAGDLLDLQEFRRRLPEVLSRKNRVLRAYDYPPMDEAYVLSALILAAEFLSPFIGDTVSPICEALDDGRQILLEGQLGVMRDLDWGVYPFVTSSSPIPAGMAAGAGIPPGAIDRIIGVTKAYTSAVGTGPFPTELHGDEGHALREKGCEYGATTGRPRRCGWFDAVATRWAAKLAGFTELVLTKLDILDGTEQIPICTGYQLDGRTLDRFPTTAAMTRVEPSYTELPGWQADTSSARTIADLPAEAATYIRKIEHLVGVPISMVSVGPERDSIIRRTDSV